MWRFCQVLSRRRGAPCGSGAAACGASTSEKVSFLVEKMDGGVRVMVKGQPKTEEVIPMKALRASISKTACAYTDKRLGPREKVGNKGGSLSNGMRAVLARKQALTGEKELLEVNVRTY